MKALQLLVSPKISPENTDASQKAIYLVAIILFANVVALAAALVLWGAGFAAPAQNVLITLVLHTGVWLLFYLTGFARLCSHVFLCVCLFEIYHDFGMDDGYGILLTALLPLGAAVLLGPAATAFWTAVSIVWAAALGPLVLRPDVFPLGAGITTAVVCLVVGLMAIIIEMRRVRSDSKADSNERKRQVSEQGLLQFVDKTFPAHLTVDGRGITSVSDGALRLLNFERSQVVGKPLNDFIHPDHLDALRVVLRNGVSHFHHEMPIRCSNGSWLWFEAFGTLIAEPGEGESVGRWVVAGREIEAERRSRDRMLRAQRLEGVGVMAAGIAHDFNNLLTVINGFAELLPPSEERTHIRHAVEDASMLTSGLTAFGKGGISVATGVDVVGAVRRWEPMFKSLLGAQIRLELDLPDGVLGAQIGESQLNQVLLNLVTNAKEAMPQGGLLRLRVATQDIASERAEEHGVEPGAHVGIWVSDSGHGMPAEVLDRAFDPFFSTKEGARSSGLGLSSVYGIVRQQRGYVEITSDEGGGTEVLVMLASRDVDDVQRPVVYEIAARQKHAGQSILLAEDDDLVRAWLERTLRNHGFSVLTAVDGEHALQIAATHDLQLLLTDIIMSGMRGTELARRIREHHRELPVLFVSGYADAEIAEWREFDDWRTQFLAKPFRSDELLNAIAQLLSEDPLLREGRSTSS